MQSNWYLNAQNGSLIHDNALSEQPLKEVVFLNIPDQDKVPHFQFFKKLLFPDSGSSKLYFQTKISHILIKPLKYWALLAAVRYH